MLSGQSRLPRLQGEHVGVVLEYCTAPLTPWILLLGRRPFVANGLQARPPPSPVCPFYQRYDLRLCSRGLANRSVTSSIPPCPTRYFTLQYNTTDASCVERCVYAFRQDFKRIPFVLRRSHHPISQSCITTHVFGYRTGPLRATGNCCSTVPLVYLPSPTHSSVQLVAAYFLCADSSSTALVATTPSVPPVPSSFSSSPLSSFAPQWPQRSCDKSPRRGMLQWVSPQ